MTYIMFTSLDLDKQGKVSAIKALRAMTGMGLKDAKDLIEDVIANKPREVVVDLAQPVAREALDKYEAAGGTYQFVNNLAQAVRAALQIAIRQNKVADAAALLSIFTGLVIGDPAAIEGEATIANNYAAALRNALDAALNKEQFETTKILLELLQNEVEVDSEAE